MIAFGMGNTLLTFVDRYYEYDGERDIRDKGLTIGGYESAWLADLVAAFVLENTTELFNETVYDGIYRDDGLVIMEGVRTNREIGEWLSAFQAKVNVVTGYEGLVFTVCVWREKDNDEVGHPKAEVVKSAHFPFLDMKMSWSAEGDLRFGVYLKPGQQLKYLNSDSSHPPHCFKAITKGVFGRLASLTSLTDESRYKSIKDLYPLHHKALESAGLAPEYVPTLQEVLDLNKGKEKRKEEKNERDKQRNRSVYFCIGYSKFWKEPIHRWIMKLRNRFDIKWLRISMSYHRFPNLREMLAGDLASKLTEGVQSLDFKVRDCNCKDPSGKGKCQYGNMCRVPIVIYKITCKMTNKIYIGNTQQNFKKRMTGHFQDVRTLMGKGVHSDSYARHFAGIWPRGAEIPTPGMQRDLIKCNILWKGNPISVVKTFGKSTCALCNRERMEIVKLSRKIPELLINSCSEIHGACRHKPRFHRYQEQEIPSADDRKKREKVVLEAPNPRRRRIISIETDGNESVGSHSHHGTEPCGFISV
jgi:hypothetical protein